MMMQPRLLPHTTHPQAQACMQQFSELIDKVAADEAYLESTLKQVRRRCIPYSNACQPPSYSWYSAHSRGP